MGKEWYKGSSGSSSKSSCSKRAAAEKDFTTTTTTTSGCMSVVFQLFDFHHFQFLLNHHHHHASSSSFKPEDHHHHHHHTVIRSHSGVDAPRNSLEELEEEPPLSSHSTSLKGGENLNIPVSGMGIQIKTRTSSSCSEMSSSPGAKTPNLVARLMGLDLLPNESLSPSYYSSSSHEMPENNLATKSNLHHGKLISHRHSVDVDTTTAGGGTRSLPETPRISLARRSDVDLHHHRLSLQINKENVSVGKEVEFSRFSYLKRKELKQEDEYRSPSHYARQIVKQVKESVSRKVGLDITNTLRNRGAEKARQRDELLISQSKANKSSGVLNKVDDQSSPEKHATPSCSPRLSRFLEPKQKITTSNTSTKDKSSSSPSQAHTNIVIKPQPIKVLSSKSKWLLVQDQETNEQVIIEQKLAMKSKKWAGERFSSRLKKPPQTTDIIRNKQEEHFVLLPSAFSRTDFPGKKCKQTLLSNNLLNNTVPTLLPVKKDPSPPATKLPRKQVLSAQSSKHGSRLSSHTSQTYKQETTYEPVTLGNINGRANVATTTSTGTSSSITATEYEYVTRILKRTGIHKDTQVSFTKWFSPSHPIDPCIFHHLENSNPIVMPGQLGHYWNRKLMFELVDEILVDILRPPSIIRMKPWVNVGSSIEFIGRDYHFHMQGSALIDVLCKQIRSYPCADCRVLEDIDELIDRDLPHMKMQQRIAFEEEGEGVVMEIEGDILDALIHETAVELKR